MKRLSIIVISVLLAGGLWAAERVEEIPFGDMESWVVRYIPESKIIGGKVKTLYALGPADTITGDIPYVYRQNGSDWSMSDAYAEVMGIHKAAGTVSPEKRNDGRGTACRMDVKMLDVVVMGFINIHVLVNGTIFWGQTLEPITTAKDPYKNIDFGIPFTRRPKALEFDYKCIVSPEQWIWKATGLTAPKRMEGHDECEVFLLLQKRWEDEEGNIYALRVGTAYERYDKTQAEWVNDHRIEVKYGDISKDPDYKDYMGFDRPCRALNSKGEMKPIQEVGWAEADVAPTHAILMLTSGIYEAFYGHDGNCFWVDNVAMVYDD